MHGVPVEVAAGAVVVLGGSGVGVAGEDLRVAKGDPGIQGVGNSGVPQRVRADVPLGGAATAAILVTIR